MLLWGVQSAISTFAVLAYRHGLPRPEIPGVEPSVAVILPVKGNQNLDRFLHLLRAQHYSRYRIIASVESENDPARSLLVDAQRHSGAPIDIVIAGPSSRCGQKVWNQLAALEKLTPDDEIVAFIDADTLPTPLWLPRLVFAMVDAGGLVVTGYRWMTPVDDRWSSSCLVAANASIATLGRGGLKLHLCWGGSVAMKRSTLESIKLKSYWIGAISDDLQLSEALRRAGIHTRAPRQCLLLTPVSISWRGFFAFGVRQYRLVWIHQPASWAIALAFLWLPPTCFMLSAPSLLSGSPSIWATLIVILILGDVRTRLRQQIQAALWPGSGPTKFEKQRWRAERLARPLWWLAHALCAAAAPMSRTVNWAGIRYQVKAPQKVLVERRL
jgi:cellulose synthase/poly-beta-1,6-N-acetylglucosamine synthase-like glycosyltransferase